MKVIKGRAFIEVTDRIGISDMMSEERDLYIKMLKYGASRQEVIDAMERASLTNLVRRINEYQQMKKTVSSEDK